MNTGDLCRACQAKLPYLDFKYVLIVIRALLDAEEKYRHGQALNSGEIEKLFEAANKAIGSTYRG